MKLIYVTNARIPTEKAHGLQIMKSCEAFALKDIDIKLVVPSRINTLPENPFDYYSVKKTFPIKKIFCIDLFGFSFLPKRFVFHLQSLSFGFFATLYLLSNKNKNTVFYSRDFATLFFLCLFGFNPVAEIHDYRSRARKSVINYIFKKSRKVIVNSAGTLGLIKNHYYNIPIDKFLIVPNGVDLEFFDIKDSKETAREKLGIPQNKKIVAHIGSLEVVGTGKGIEDLIMAFESIENFNKDTELYVIGGPDSLVNKYQKMTHSGAIRFMGRVDYKKIPLYLRAVDMVVIPLPENRHSITTSPIKLFEYLAAGKPIIASYLPSLRRYLNEKNALFFKTGDSKDMAEKIKLILENPELADNLSRQAREDSEQYSWLSRTETIKNFILSNGN